jgi:sortase (surface protein transpeptidase)
MPDLRRMILPMVALGVVTAACASPGHSTGGSSATASGQTLPGFRSVSTPATTPPPARIRIPAIDVDAPIGPLGRARDGTIDVPSRWDEVGWYADGPRPGQLGPAVLLGHVDSKTGPAVFFRLRSLRVGADVDIVRTDGTVARFAVTRLARYPKRRFPTADVYLPTLRPELRLITCGGAFDASVGHYVDNVIAYAVLVH